MIINDISYWQGEINFQKFASKSDGVILRAGFGSRSMPDNCRDARFIGYYEGFQTAGLPTGTYWFADYRKRAEQQADFYAAAVGNRWGQFHPVLDFEYYSVFGALPSGANILSWMKTFMERVDQLSGKRTMLYCNPSMLNHIRPILGWPTWIKARPLWIAHYTTAAAPATYGLEWDLWQYTDKGDGRAFGTSSAVLDMNRLRVEDLATIGYVPESADPPQPPPEQIDTEAVRAKLRGAQALIDEALSLLE